MAEERLREERMVWRKDLEGRAAILKRQLDHETGLFNGMVAKRGNPTGWRQSFPLDPKHCKICMLSAVIGF